MKDFLKVIHQGRCYIINKEMVDPRYPIETIYEYNGHVIAKVEFVPGAEEAGKKPYTVTSFNFNKESEEIGFADCMTIEEADSKIKELFIDGYLLGFEQAHNMCSELDSLRIEMLNLKNKYNMVVPVSFDNLLESLNTCKKEIVDTMGSISNLK